MFFSRRNPRPSGSRRQRPARLPVRPILEALEDRVVPTAVTIAGTDTALRNAVTAADSATLAGTGGVYQINLAAGNYNINALLGPMQLNNPNGVTIILNGATGANGGAGTTLTMTNGASRFFNVSPGVNVIIQNINMTGGTSQAGTVPAGTLTPPGFAAPGAAGGAILNNQGNLELVNDGFTNNVANGTGVPGAPVFGGPTGAGGGAIFTAGGNLTLDGVTFTNNSAIGGKGADATAAAAAAAGFFGIGGAIDSFATTVIVTNQLVANSAVGAVLPDNTPVGGIKAPLVQFNGNLAQGGAGGNGSSSHTAGAAGGFGGGGAMYVQTGSVHLFAVSMSSNSAQGGNGGRGGDVSGGPGGTGGAGGAAAGGAVEMTDTTTPGVHVASTLDIAASEFGPDALSQAAPVLPGGTPTVAGANYALGGGGGNGGNSGAAGSIGGTGGLGGDANGGAIAWGDSVHGAAALISDGSQLRLFNSTVADNVAQGGTGGQGGNGTFTGSFGGTGGAAGNGTGGGIEITGGLSNRVESDTVAGNTAAGGISGTGGRGSTGGFTGVSGAESTTTNGGGVHLFGGSTLFVNDALADNQVIRGGTTITAVNFDLAGPGPGGAPTTAVVNAGSQHNYLSSLALTPFATNPFLFFFTNQPQNANLIGGVNGVPDDPGFINFDAATGLPVPVNNTGPTFTLATGPNSVLIHAGLNLVSTVGNQDQRGQSRQPLFDIGAFQFNPAQGVVNFTFTTPASVNLTTQTSIPVSVVVTDARGNPVQGGTVRFQLFSNGSAVPGASVAAAPVVNGIAQANIPIPAGTKPGTYTVEAFYTPQGSTELGTFGTSSSISLNTASTSLTGVRITPASVFNDVANAETVTGTVSSPNGTPTGTVTATLTGPSGPPITATATVAADGTFTFSTATNNALTIPVGAAVGSYTLTLSFLDSTGAFGPSSTTVNNAVTVQAQTTSLTGSSTPTTLNQSTSAQSLTVNATLVNDGAPVNNATVDFTLLDNTGTAVAGASATGTTNASGQTGNVTLPVPANTPASSSPYTVQASWTDPNGVKHTANIGTLTIQSVNNPVTVTVTPVPAFIANPNNTQPLAVSATVTSSIGLVNEGTITFTLIDPKTGAPVASATGTVTPSGQVLTNNLGPVVLIVPPSGAATYSLVANYTDTGTGLTGKFANGSGSTPVVLNPQPTSPSPSPSQSPSSTTSPPASTQTFSSPLSAAISLIFAEVSADLNHTALTPDQLAPYDAALGSGLTQAIINAVIQKINGASSSS